MISGDSRSDVDSSLSQELRFPEIFLVIEIHEQAGAAFDGVNHFSGNLRVKHGAAPASAGTPVLSHEFLGDIPRTMHGSPCHVLPLSS